MLRTPKEVVARVDYAIGIREPIKWTGPVSMSAGRFHRDEEAIVKTLMEFGGVWEPTWLHGQQLPCGRAHVPPAQVKASAAALQSQGYVCNLPEQYR